VKRKVCPTICVGRVLRFSREDLEALDLNEVAECHIAKFGTWEITLDEALEILEQTHEAGLAHMALGHETPINLTRPYILGVNKTQPHGYVDMVQVMKAFVEAGYGNTMSWITRRVLWKATRRRERPTRSSMCGRVASTRLVERAEAELSAGGLWPCRLVQVGQ
jgi:hypothetical protein